MELHKKMVDAWDNMVPDRGRHIDRSETQLNAFYEECMTPDFIDFKDKIIVNYGCGAGRLEKYLFENYGIKRSFSMDISTKSVAFAQKHLKKYDSTVFLIEPKDYMSSVSRKKKDIFTSCAVIQHFPTEEYFDGWLKMLNKQKYEWLVLHYKIIDNLKGVKETIFRENVYQSLTDVVRACITETAFLKKRLTNYELYNVKKIVNNTREISCWRLKT